MRILIDTNVLISAALFPGSVPYQAYVKAVSYPNHGLLCEQNIEELTRIFRKKFPAREEALERYLAEELPALEVIRIPTERTALERKIRDPNDRSILRAAVAAEADILLTGDKDFLESGVVRPSILTPAEFLKV